MRRIRAALVLKAFGDPRLVEQLYEETDANSKNVLHAMEAIAPRLLKLRAEGKPDIAKPLLDVVRTLFSVRQSGKHLEDFIGNGNLFSAYDVDSSPCAWRQRADRGHHGAGASDLPWRARSSTPAPGQTDDAGSGQAQPAEEITSGERVVTMKGRAGVVLDHQPGKMVMKVQYDDGQIGYPQKRNVMREGEPNANQETTSETAARPAGAARADDAAVAPEYRPPARLARSLRPKRRRKQPPQPVI